MKKSILISGLCLGIAVFVVAFWSNRLDPRLSVKAYEPDKSVDKAALAFLSTLDNNLKKEAVYPFDSSQRYDWHYFPRERKGVPLKKMNKEQKEAAMEIMRASLSLQGFEKSQGVIELEGILGELEGRRDYRDPGLYYFTVFGDPGSTDPWGWSVEGHHLSLNFSSVTQKLISGTPSFIGANPATVPEGPHEGWQLLDEEISLAVELMNTFSPTQKEKVMFSNTTPGEIVSGTDREAEISEIKGLAMKEMNARQKKLLHELVRLYIDNFTEKLAAQHWANIKEAGIENLHFGWAGSTNLAENHYYRIHSSAILIEYDNSRDNANHVHTVVRDLKNDFGHDALKAHYANHKH